MNPQPEANSPAAATPNSPFPTPNSDSPGRGRPRALDDAKRREICALVAGGCGLREAAHYVRCGINTIRREADRNPEFQEQLRRSEMYAQLSPLRAMQHAVATHWRAAAWMLERAFPERFARPEPGAFGARQARQLLDEMLTIVDAELMDPLKSDRMKNRIRATFEYTIRANCDRHRTTRNLRRAMAYFEEKARLNQPPQFGFAPHDLDELVKVFTPHPKPATPPKQPAAPPNPVPSRPSAQPAAPAKAPSDAEAFADILGGLIGTLAAENPPAPQPFEPRPNSGSTSAPPAPNNP